MEERCKVENRKRKASDSENYVEEVEETDNHVLNKTAEDQSSEKCELSR